MERIRELLDKIPMSLIVMAFIAYLGWDAYDFTNGDSSELVQARGQLETTRKDNEVKKKEIASAKEFYEKLELKRLELRALAQQLDQLKATLSERLDIPAFMRTVDLEASRVGLRILSFKPTSAKAEEYYLEQSFELTFKAAFAQLLVFLERLASVEKIVRVDSFDMSRQGSSTAPFVELGGKIELKAYSYRGSQADELAKKTTAGTSPATGSGAPNGGAKK